MVPTGVFIAGLYSGFGLLCGYIYAPNRSKQPWVIVQSHFVPSFGRRFSDWDSEKEPVDYKDVIELMADLLNPDVSLEELMQLRQS